MTKTEIALTIARQYAEVERTMHEMMNLYDAEVKEFGRKSPETRWSQRQLDKARSGMDTLQETVKALGINNKTWHDAISKAYIENSNKEKELA